jgi:hypothetical protein
MGYLLAKKGLNYGFLRAKIRPHSVMFPFQTEGNKGIRSSETTQSSLLRSEVRALELERQSLRDELTDLRAQKTIYLFKSVQSN